MEFILKSSAFSGLREIDRYPQAICPSQNSSQKLIEEMITQVVHLHPDLEYIHIGCDEVYHMGVCPYCVDKMTKMNWGKNEVFIDHVKWVANFVISTFGHIRPMIWDDEFRKLDRSSIIDSGLGSLVDIVVWNYVSDVEIKLDDALWSKYSKVFRSVWIGSAFKGANKVNSIVVNETLYLRNHFSWMDIVEKYENQISFKGIILTGWQRYDHFSVLCEVLPVAIPSLASCLFYVDSLYKLSIPKVIARTATQLQCQSTESFFACAFPGYEMYEAMESFDNVKVCCVLKLYFNHLHDHLRILLSACGAQINSCPCLSFSVQICSVTKNFCLSWMGG